MIKFIFKVKNWLWNIRHNIYYSDWYPIFVGATVLIIVFALLLGVCRLEGFRAPSDLSIAVIDNDRTTHRESSWDKKGTNFDYWTIKPGETQVIANLKGPGCIKHIWLTQYSKGNEDHFKRVKIRMTWDGKEAVNVPLGDFFCLGHSMVNSFNSALFMVSATGMKKDGLAGMNCYIPMPYNQNAKIEIINNSSKSFIHYFHVDYETFPVKVNNVGYFYAHYNEWDSPKVYSTEGNPVNLDGEYNYPILDTKGEGQYIGCNFSVVKGKETWWGEGDEMIWIDGDKKPTINGTGTEDYFGQAWGTQGNAYLYSGSSLVDAYTGGYHTYYVFHVVNPIRFKKSIKISMEHGTGNNLTNKLSSVAYWYQK